MAALATTQRLGCKPIRVDEAYLAYLVRNIHTAILLGDNFRLAEFYCEAYLLPIGLQLLVLARLAKCSDDVSDVVKYGQ